MEGGAPPGDDNFDALSIEERLAHKSWKARISAYTALITAFRQTVSESDPTFRPYVNNPGAVREWVRDGNAVSQEKGVEAAVALVEWGGKAAGRTREEVVPSVVEKCLGSARAGTRAKAVELCLLYVEVEEDQGEGVISCIIPGLDVKQPKVVAGSVTVLKELVRLFGPKSITIPPILRVLPKIFAHADKTVRAEGTLLALALHSFLGPGLTPHLSDLKPVQQKELGEAFKEADERGEGFGKGAQTRWTRKQQRERDVKEAEGALEGKGAEEEDEVEEAVADPFEFVPPAPILSALPTDFYTHLSSSKWKDRKELALEPLLALLQAPRLENGNYDELTRALAARMTDANVVCVQLAAACLEQLAKGLRDEFAKYRGAVVAPVLARTKEKKASVLEALGGALDAFFLSATIGEIAEDVVTYAKDRNPSVKAETIKWLVRSLKLATSPPPKPELASLVEVLIKALEDSGEPVRVAAAEGLGTLMKVVGERALGGQVEGLDELRKTKVMEAFEKAEVRCKPGAPSRTAPPPAAALVAKPKPKPVAAPAAAPPTPKAPPKAAPPPRVVAKKPPVASTSAAPPPKKVAPPASSNAATAKASEPLKYKFSQEDAEERAEGILPPAVVAGLADSNWKQRLEAVSSLFDWLSGGEVEIVESELVVRYLSKKPGWKESNFQVGSKMFGVFQLLAEQSPSFSKASAALSIPALSDKLGDMKLKKSAGDALTAYAEKSSLQFVLSQAYEPMKKQKAPKAQADSLVWVEQAIRDFGIGGLSVRELIDFLISALKSTNAAVRTSATKTLVTLKLYVGSSISSFLQDLNPALLTTIESEFDKVAADSPPEPTRVAVDTVVAAAPAAGGKAGKGKATDDDPLDELFPRVDLDKLVSSANANACNDTNWKMRKEALENIQSILEANKRLKPSNLSDLATALKLRMTDSNKVVQGLALDVVARIATGMGKPFDKHARIFAGPVAGVLADQKTNIRAAGVATLTAMADAAGLDCLISGFEKPLEAQNPILRKELLTWLEARFEDEDVVATLDLTHIASAVISCLEDRNVDVRKSATALLPIIVARAGYGFVMDQTSKLKPASRSTVVPLIEAARGSGPPAAPWKAPAPAASKPSAAGARPTAKVLRAAPPAFAPSPVDDEPPSRPASTRPLPSLSKGKAPAGRAPPPSSSTPSAREAPFKTSDPHPKQIRASKETGSLKWIVEGNPRPDQVEALLQQMTPSTSADFIGLLFSKDHNAERDFAAALTLIDDCATKPGTAESYDLSAEEMRARLVANVDVIFKYITLRIGLSSTTITVKCLDVVEHLIPMLDEQQHKLSDYETTALLISLINKVGDGKETIRQRVRHIFKILCSVYPYSKVFNAILEHGLLSKNSRTRAECAEELGSIYQRYGVDPVSINKALPLIAKLISDRDPTARTAALTAIGSAYSIVGGDVVWKAVGAIPAKERSMLEERLKRTKPALGVVAATTLRSATPISPAATPVHAEERAPTPSSPAATPRTTKMQSVRPSVVAAARPQIPRPASTLLPPAPSLLKPSGIKPRGIPRTSTSTASSRTVSTGTSSNSLYDEEDDQPSLSSITFIPDLIAAAATTDLARSAEVFKRLQAKIIGTPEALVPEADHLIEVIVEQMSVAFSDIGRNTPQSKLRLCKHLMQTLSAFFEHKVLGHAVSAEFLTLLLAELTGRLLDTSESTESEAISSLSKVLNMVLIRIFHHADQTAVFSALFAVLQDATVDLRELRGAELTDRAKYAELVMKCLWKVSKTVKESLENEQLSASRLLRDINTFLTAIAPAEWRRRSVDGIPLADMPLRTVKTILQQVVSVYGEQVFDALDEIDSAENSFVYQYLYRLASTPAPGRVPQSGRSLSHKASSSSMGSMVREPLRAAPESPVRRNGAMNGEVASPAVGGSKGAEEIEANLRLKEIFDLIGDPVKSRDGIAALYEFQKSHPELESRVTGWISKTGAYFQTYLRRALDNLKTADEERSSAAPDSPFHAPSPPTDARPTSTSTTPSRLSSSNPRASRQSLGSGSNAGGVGPNQAAKLAELQSMFGFSAAGAETGRMD